MIRASPVGLVPGSGRSAAWLLCIAAIAAGCTNDGCGSVPEPSLDVGESAPITLSYIDGSWMPIVFDDIGWTEPDVDPPLGTGELEGTLTLVGSARSGGEPGVRGSRAPA